MAEPAFHTVALVDIEGFGDRPNPVQRQVRADLYEVVRAALSRAGLDPARIDQEDRGDGILMVDPDVSVLEFAGRFVRELDDGLREKARTSSTIARIRLRLAVHHGMCEHDGEGWVGAAVNTTARLVDAPPLKAALAAADRANLGLIVSRQVFDEVIRHDYRSVDSSTFERVVIDAKELRGETAWIQVPGYSYPPGVAAMPTPAPSGTGPKKPKPRKKTAKSGFFFKGNTKIRVEGDQFVGDKFVNGGGQ
ncbi:hypothetical protein GAR06_03442 [Micromonospora saelicesensis]|uniref:hypothetical protein n=1 Tax=Micromonospora saelicesensis TaxID=285676 RepID=UPI000DC4B2A4|nr:hypothetical protein [Micromonospora saelicesensis]RAO45251.1 hypothetical protein GAR06_03442 [Micromonospora saelicesensis]RAO50851.1 hypothetical protein PSN01_04415 [Micromonospora saelicesensis]